MRLINTSTLELEEFLSLEAIEYAVLSHTWSDEEVSFADIITAKEETSQSIAVRGKKGFEKIVKASRKAAQDGIRYVWIDTCCIDQSSSAELSEAINSMFRWYRQSKACYAYLADVTDSSGSDIVQSRCFTRGWTLQELLAPKSVVFLDSEWRVIGTKTTMTQSLHEITGIEEAALEGEPLERLSVARKMSWDYQRGITRAEDRAYALLGIFNISMPLLYGEGNQAFNRLQREIIARTPGNEPTILWTKHLTGHRTVQAGQHQYERVDTDFATEKDLRARDYFSDSGLAPSAQSRGAGGASARISESRVYEVFGEDDDISDSGLGPSVPVGHFIDASGPDSESEMDEVFEEDNDLTGGENLPATSGSLRSSAPDNISGCPSEQEPTDDDLQSIMTHPDDVDSRAPSEPSLLLLNAESLTASIIITNEKLKLVCHEACSMVGRQRCCRQIARLLKYLYFGLSETSTNSTQKNAIKFLRSRWSRTRIARHVLEALDPEAEDDKGEQPTQDVVDKSIMMERFLAQLDADEQRVDADREGESSESDSDASSQDQNDEDFGRLRDVEKFLETSPALTSMTHKLSRFLLPAFLIGLSQKMVSVPFSHISFSESDSRSWSDAMKSFLQTITGEDWIWHPLLPPKRVLSEDEVRLRWNCHCGTPMSADIPKRYFRAYRLMLDSRPADERSSHVCWRRRCLLTTDDATYRAAPQADTSGKLAVTTIQNIGGPVSSATSIPESQSMTDIPASPQLPNISLWPKVSRARRIMVWYLSKCVRWFDQTICHLLMKLGFIDASVSTATEPSGTLHTITTSQSSSPRKAPTSTGKGKSLTSPDAGARGADIEMSPGLSISVQPNFLADRFVLFAVSGKRITLDLENINVQDPSHRPEFLC